MTGLLIHSGRLDECVVAITRLMGRPRSMEALKEGVPHSSDGLSSGLVNRAIEPAGLVASVKKISIRKLHKQTMPALLMLKSGSWTILTKILEDDKYELRAPLEPQKTRIVSKADLAREYSGQLILIKFNDNQFASLADGSNQVGSASGPHWFWSVVRRFSGEYFHVALAALLINVLSLAAPIYIMNVYDRVIPNSAAYTLIALSVGATLAVVFDFVFKMLRSGIVNDVGRRADIIVGSKIFEHILDLKLKNRPPMAGIFSNQIREFDAVKEFFTSSSLIAATDFLFLGIGIFVMFILVGPLAWAVALAVPIVLLISALVQRPMYKATQDNMMAGGLKQARTVELATMLDTYRVLGAGPTVLAEWEPVLAHTSKTSQKAKFWSNLAQNATGFVQQMVTVVIVVLGVYLVQNNTISPGAMIAAVIISGRVLAPLANIASTLIRFNQSLNSFRSMDSLMTLPVEHPPGHQFTTRSIKEGSIDFKDVTFSYIEDQAPALKSVSLHIKPGERVGIIGRIGSGKSTLGRLVANLYGPDEGTVKIDGIDIQQYDPADLRAGVGFLMQDMPLRIGTIRDNIVLGRPDATDEEVIEAARFSGVERFAASHPLGFGIPTGEGGRNLSGGQRQAVSLARVLIRKPQILILDEPTTSLDPQTEKKLLGQLDKYLGKDRTLMLITQRPAALKLVTRLIVVDDGKVVLDGPRDEIIKKLQTKKPEKSTTGRATTVNVKPANKNAPAGHRNDVAKREKLPKSLTPKITSDVKDSRSEPEESPAKRQTGDAGSK